MASTCISSGGVPALTSETTLARYSPKGVQSASTLMVGFCAWNSLSRASALSACSWLTVQKDQVIWPPGLASPMGLFSDAPPPAPHAAAKTALPATALPRNARRVTDCICP